MRKSILALSAAAATVLTFGAAGSAMAASHPSNVVGSFTDGNGTAGFYTQSFADQYTQVQGTFKLNVPSTDQLFPALQNGGIGIELCNASTGYTAQVGVIDSGGGTWTVGYWKGVLSGNPIGTGDPCDGNSFFNVSHAHAGFTNLGIATIGAGDSIEAQIKDVHHGLLYTVALLTSTGATVANYQYFQHSFPGYFNEAGAGVSTDLDILSAPATNDLVDFSNLTATDTNGLGTRGFAVWDAVQVNSGFPGYAPLITTSALNPSAYVVTNHPGHRYYYGSKGHRRYRWIKGYTTTTGGGPSSFSILTGSPIGI